MTQLIIARHGNTFLPGETPTRVGQRTDLPLVTSGIQQALAIGEYFKTHHIYPDVIYTSTLKRTQQTAAYACPNLLITPLSCFDEIDYGPDENKPESEVIARIGQAALDAWNTEAIVPSGWQVNPDKIIKDWFNFSQMIQEKHAAQTVFVVTSNGIARFAPYLTDDFETSCKHHDIKLKTGALCRMQHTNAAWQITAWNIRP